MWYYSFSYLLNFVSIRDKANIHTHYVVDNCPEVQYAYLSNRTGEQHWMSLKLTGRWVGYTDGGARVSNPGLGACGFVLLRDRIIQHRQGKFLGHSVTNNEAEYQGLIALLEYAVTNSISGILIHSDSQLMVNQIHGVYKVKNEDLMYFSEYAKMLLQRTSCQLKWIPREENTAADDLVNETLDGVQTEQRSNPNAF